MWSWCKECVCTVLLLGQTFYRICSPPFVCIHYPRREFFSRKGSTPQVSYILTIHVCTQKPHLIFLHTITLTHAHVYTRTHTGIHTNSDACTHINWHAQYLTHTLTHTHTHTHTLTHTHIYIWAHLHSCTHILYRLPRTLASSTSRAAVLQEGAQQKGGHQPLWMSLPCKMPSVMQPLYAGTCVCVHVCVSGCVHTKCIIITYVWVCARGMDACARQYVWFAFCCVRFKVCIHVRMTACTFACVWYVHMLTSISFSYVKLHMCMQLECIKLFKSNVCKEPGPLDHHGHESFAQCWRSCAHSCA